ncbi:MAG: 2-amino-4-hydroxy-6-hydroxymethyldihydropteridine diphosphokinase [Planctomycetes bacterium]|nr:2-amino-4-hydroxy-6-hydroxymethyldihydropteridine diphosphokinase [Planctomycetota bacterium]MDA8375550.1 2-amino-4-hydroxy-6-hydroxymethyldihydropteridine diphosphokinase [Planctomycetia bacterium]
MAAICYIALGSNLGNRAENLHRALAAMTRLPTTRVERVSDFINTAPVGGPPGQGDYLNAAVRLATDLLPEKLLLALFAIERDTGRDRRCEIRHGPRIIDLDVLLYDNLLINNQELEIPHPRMHERVFVLRPLAQIAPELIHPRLGKSIRALLQACPTGSDVPVQQV